MKEEKKSNKLNNEEFLQSPEWLSFQTAFGRKTYFLQKPNFEAGIIEHALPIVGKYFYLPRGPIMEFDSDSASNSSLKSLVELAKKNQAGWIRIEPLSEELLEVIQKVTACKIVKAPYDVQPKEVFVLDITKSEEQLLQEMKAKTRYNINLAKKKGVKVISHRSSVIGEEGDKCVEEFLRLTREMAARQGIAAHPENYYRKMLETFPPEMLRIYCAKYQGEIIAANLVLFYGETATYLHGASGDKYRNMMAPYLLQWQAILDAKQKDCTKYDFGGVQTSAAEHKAHSDLSGVSNFKLGFAPNAKTVVFPGTFDIIANPRAYALYRGLQKAKMMVRKFRK